MTLTDEQRSVVERIQARAGAVRRRGQAVQFPGLAQRAVNRPRVFKGELAARLAYAEGITIAEAARRVGCRPSVACRRYRELYPDAPKRRGRPSKDGRR